MITSKEVFFFIYWMVSLLPQYIVNKIKKGFFKLKNAIVGIGKIKFQSLKRIKINA